MGLNDKCPIHGNLHPDFLCPDKDKQVKMEFSYTYSVKEMGVLMPETKIIHLFDSFIREKLRGGYLDTVSVGRKKDKTTKIGCPFCQKGLLKLEKVEPEYSGGPHSVPSSLRHVGNKYEYSCSNPECEGRFVGTYTWMHID